MIRNHETLATQNVSGGSSATGPGRAGRRVGGRGGGGREEGVRQKRREGRKEGGWKGGKEGGITEGENWTAKASEFTKCDMAQREIGRPSGVKTC